MSTPTTTYKGECLDAQWSNPVEYDHQGQTAIIDAYGLLVQDLV